MFLNNIHHPIIRTARSNQWGLQPSVYQGFPGLFSFPLWWTFTWLQLSSNQNSSLLERQGASRCRRRLKCYSLHSSITIHIICRCHLFWFIKVCIIHNTFFPRQKAVKTEGWFKIMWAFLSFIRLPEPNLHILRCIASLLTGRMKSCSYEAYVLYNSAHCKKETLHNESIVSVSEASL